MTAPQTVADVQHTPGPWHVGSDGVVKVGAAGADHYCPPLRVASGWREDAWCGSDGNDETRANARLIAAAPDLRAALNSILPSPLCGESWDLPDEEMVHITVTLGELRAARAALRAAATSARQGETK